MTFRVIDKRTGKEPIFDHNHIFKEKWFKESGLIYCDIDGWYIGEEGELVLIDDCGNVGYPPVDRFDVVFDERTHGEWVKEPKSLWDIAICSLCNETCIGYRSANFCPNCGASMRKEGDSE